MKSLEELKAIRERMQGEVGVRKADANETRVVVGMATCGIASGARPVLNALAEEVRAKKLDNVVVTQTGCIGLCQYEPIVEVFAPGKEKVSINVRSMSAAPACVIGFCRHFLTPFLEKISSRSRPPLITLLISPFSHARPRARSPAALP